MQLSNSESDLRLYPGGVRNAPWPRLWKTHFPRKLMGKQLFLQGARPGSSSSRGLAAQGCFLALPSSLSLLSGRSLTHQGSYLLQGRCPAMQRPALSLSHSTHLLPRGAVILAVLHERLIFWPVYSVFDLQTILLVYVTDTSRP